MTLGYFEVRFEEKRLAEPWETSLKVTQL